jgi:tetratricopeptide (TPR) repeat protein
MYPGIVIGSVCALLLVAPIAHGAEAVQDERIATYKEFRNAFDAADYAKALPLATQVVQQTRSQFGADSLELVNPRTNVATTWYRMGRYGEALDGYREVLTQLDQQDDATNPLLIRPLHGIGATLHALNRDAEAIAPLKRAVDITRNREGMQSPTQLSLLKELVGCYMSTGHVLEAGTEQQYAFNVAEATYGRNDIRMLGPLDDYARWNEAAGRYTAARALHLRAVQLADSVLGSTTVQSVNGLRGIARTYRLAYVNGETAETAAATTAADSFSEAMAPAPVSIVPAQSAEGERALRVAIQRLAMAIPAQPQRLGEVQVDLGDWYLTGGSAARALPVYREAWNSLSLAGGQKLLAAPVPLTYRPPPIAVVRGLQDPNLYDEHTVELRLSIDANGSVRDTVVVNPVPERESAERAVVSAVKRATFRPVITAGTAATSTDQVFRERVYVKRPKVK